MGKKEFAKLMKEYVEEIADPKYKKVNNNKHHVHLSYIYIYIGIYIIYIRADI